ncbi:radical SAM protein [Actinomadura rugatobispora]|uniref:Radical SAM protein n=1 Tax=Actinomadura rugatobispora TaxID=1994 RepID=A0ABW1A5Z5_9ACTN|nr:hypothetical protein GCM10010200_084100 [Actinomadura rugatobispora]
MDTSNGPDDVVWDVTYACPLRCTHCYSESGRRPSRQLGHQDMLRVSDAIISLRPKMVSLAGGEPLIVRGIFEIAERISQAGIAVVVYTGGWTLRQDMLDERIDPLRGIAVSLDGATARTHDRIRGRAGSFDRALNALGLLDRAAAERAARGAKPVKFGLETVVVRSNFDHLPEICATIAPRFPRLSLITFGACVPTGLATREGFAEHELLTDEQVARLADPEYAGWLQSKAPSSVEVSTTDNHLEMLHPDHVRDGIAPLTLVVEPDGEVRGMPTYEGTVGNLLDEPAYVLWERSVARWTDPFVTETLEPVRTMAQWAAAARRIDYHFGSAEVQARIDRRPAFAG